MNNQYNIILKSFDHIYLFRKESKIKYWCIGIALFGAIILFLPWTQNIKAKGTITTLYQDQRPQKLNSPIPGKIVKWWVKEGDIVKKGDTILQISEVKEDYLDPNLISRTQQQIEAKVNKIEFYKNKIKTNENQFSALQNAMRLKQKQIENKIKQLNSKLNAENAELKAASNELTLTKNQFERQQKMYDDGLVSQTMLQQRSITYQNAMSKKITIENKIAQTIQEISNANIEQNAVMQDYNEKMNKTQGDKFSGLSEVATSEGEIAKLKNQVSNYTIRNGMYYILAPQDGQIVDAKKSGIGEILKDSEDIVEIIPTKIHYAVQLYVRPMDLPLIHKQQKVRFMFDGFPAIVFSGWPNNSYGTFGGIVLAIENNANEDGLFRVIVTEDTTDKNWPTQLKIGSGAQGIALLKDVPIWYELWRNINGFPQDYYEETNKSKKNKPSKK